jgi:hypothetical protein
VWGIIALMPINRQLWLFKTSDGKCQCGVVGDTGTPVTFDLGELTNHLTNFFTGDATMSGIIVKDFEAQATVGKHETSSEYQLPTFEAR